MTNTDILFASLVGSKTAGSIPRFKAVQNELRKHVHTNDVNVLPESKDINVKHPKPIPEMDNIWTADAPVPEERQFFPLSFSLTQDGERFLLPYEPMINISGSNTVIRRNVAKFNNGPGQSPVFGSVHERWSQNDYEITITGALIGSIMTGDVSDCYPISDFRDLSAICTTAKSIYVFCEPLHLLNINKIVIESFSFPFTKGENVQAYEIRAYSDNDPNLLIQLENE